MNINTPLFIIWVALTFAYAGSALTEPLPQGNSGIAARHPGDAGIGEDPAVIFADDFESYTSPTALTGRWTESHRIGNFRIVSEDERYFGGRKALEFTVPKQSREVTNNLTKVIEPGRDVLFLRYYAKFDFGFDVLGSSHNGSTISAQYCCPGERADGMNKFLVSFEAWREDVGTPNPGALNVYVYHPDQRSIWGDHFFPSGRVLPFDVAPGDFGREFIARPEIIPSLGRWYCYELMVKANTPGVRDGRIAMWLDGRLIGDFPNLRLRDTSALRIDRFSIDLHVRRNTLGAARKWYGNVVAASSYIGPMVTADSSIMSKEHSGVR